MLMKARPARRRLSSLVALAALLVGTFIATGPPAGAQGTASASFTCAGDIRNLFGYTVTASGTAYWSYAPVGFAIDRIDYQIQAFKDGKPAKMGNKSNIDITYFDEFNQTKIYFSPDRLRPSGTLRNRDGSPLFVTTETFLQVVTVTADVRFTDPVCQVIGVIGS